MSMNEIWQRMRSRNEHDVHRREKANAAELLGHFGIDEMYLAGKRTLLIGGHADDVQKHLRRTHPDFTIEARRTGSIPGIVIGGTHDLILVDNLEPNDEGKDFLGKLIGGLNPENGELHVARFNPPKDEDALMAEREGLRSFADRALFFRGLNGDISVDPIHYTAPGLRDDPFSMRSSIQYFIGYRLNVRINPQEQI